MKNNNKIFIGRSLSYQEALSKYKMEVDFDFDENSFFYCVFSGQAVADPIKITEEAS